MLYIDARWDGHHGIGRFSREILRRLDVDAIPLESRLRPWSPTDVILPQRLKLGRGDLVYNPGYNAGISAATQIVTVHDLIHLDDECESSATKRLYYNMVVRRAIERAGTVITVSETSRKAIIRWLKTPKVDVVNVGNGCSVEFSIDGAKSQMSPYFMYVGNLKPHKNFDVLLAALAKRDAYKLVAVTSSSSEVMERSRKYGVSSQVTVLTGLSDPELAAVYRGSSGVLVPSTLEGFGLPAVEAMACGIPVASWTGCLSVAEIRGLSGVTVHDAASGEEWAAAMDRLAEISSAGRVRPSKEWRSRYDWESVASRIRDVLAGRR